MKSCAPTNLATATTRPGSLSTTPMAMFSRTDPVNSCTSCSTQPIWARNWAGEICAMSVPSTSTRPAVGTIGDALEDDIAHQRRHRRELAGRAFGGFAHQRVDALEGGADGLELVPGRHQLAHRL